MVKIKLKKTSTPGKMPNQSSSAIEVGELLMNIASASTADNFLTTLKANGKSGTTSDYIKWSDDEANNKKFASKTDFDALVEDIEDNELVIATALNQLNESAGFSEGGLSVLPNQQSLTEAIQDLRANKSDTGHTHSQYLTSQTQANWNTTATTDASYIKNKPTLSKFTVDGVTGNTIGLVPLTGGTMKEYSIDKVPSATTADSAVKDGNGNNIVNTYATKSSVVQSDWWETGSTMPAYIKNKPAISNYTIEGITGSSVYLMNSQTGQYTTKFIGTGSTIIGQTGNTLEVYNLANGATGTITVGGGGSTTQKQADWLTTATTDASYIKNKPTITGSTILGVTGNTVSLKNLTTGASSTANIGDNTVLNSKTTLINTAALTRSIASGMCLDNIISSNNLKLQGGGTWGSLTQNAILTISRFNTDKYSSQLGFSSTGMYYRGFTNSLPTSAATWQKVLLSNDTISATTSLVRSNDSQQAKLYLVGTTTAGSSDYKQLYNDSRIYTSGGCLFATSDERLKDFYEDVDCDLDALKSIPKKYFSWKSDDGKGRQVGTSAQELRKLYPEIVSVDEDGTHSVAYDRLSIVALSAIDKLYDTIKELQTKNEELEKRIKDLENK